MTITVAFDVYDTLIDTHGVVQRASNSIFDLWEISPSVSIQNLLELADAVKQFGS